MMLRISRQTVRQTWRLYAGAFVALAAGVVLIAAAVTMIGAVDATANRPGITPDERMQLDDLAAMFGIMSGVALFMAMFVVASTFGFVIAARRRQLGLLRLIGATPRQVRRMVLGESALVAVAATVAGCLLATALAPLLPTLLRARGITDLQLDLPAPWIAWTVAVPCGAGVALLGSWRASKRASRVSPAAALQEAVVERRRPSVWQLLFGILCMAAVLATLLLVDQMSPLFALVAAILLPEVAVVGLVCFGSFLFPRLAGLLARPFVQYDVAARLARDHLRTSARAPAALAAPVLAISAIAGSMILSLSLIADWTTALDRARLHADLVVQTGGDRAVVEKLAAADELDVVDPRITVQVGLRDGDVDDVEAVDLDTITQARGLRAVEGDLEPLRHEAVAVTETYATDQGVDVGDHVRLGIGGRDVRLPVAAIVDDAPDLYADILVPAAMIPRELSRAVPEVVFVEPGPGADVSALLAGTAATVLPADAWIDEVDQQNRAANNVGLWVLLGPGGLYAAIAIVNAVLIGTSQRRTQLRTIGLLGATLAQRRRMAVWEAGLVGVAGLLLGAAVTGYVGWLARTAIVRDVPGTSITVPWVPLAAVIGVCLGLTLLAAVVGSRGPARQAATAT